MISSNTSSSSSSHNKRQQHSHKVANAFRQAKETVTYYLLAILIMTVAMDSYFFVHYELSQFQTHLSLDYDDGSSAAVGVVLNPEQIMEKRKRFIQKRRVEEQRKKKIFYQDPEELEKQRLLKEKEDQHHNIEKQHNMNNYNERINYRTSQREFVKDLLKDAGFFFQNGTSTNPLAINETVLDQLPTYRTVRLYTAMGGKVPPVLYGQETCEKFRTTVPPEQRMVGPAGMFKTGTNLLAYLLKKNCYIPVRQDRYGDNATAEDLGMRWQVPWGKHNPAGYKLTHMSSRAMEKMQETDADFINSHYVLPVVTVRHPYSWMASMCVRGHTVLWKHVDRCPHIKKRVRTDPKNVSVYEYDWNHATVTYGEGTKEYNSIAHLWNAWNKDYHKVKYPRLMVRYEDLLFYPKLTTQKICECVGGELLHKDTTADDKFDYVLGHGQGDNRYQRQEGDDIRRGLLQALIKHGRPMKRNGGFKKHQYKFALEALDEDLMADFGYEHPKAHFGQEQEKKS